MSSAICACGVRALAGATGCGDCHAEAGASLVDAERALKRAFDLIAAGDDEAWRHVRLSAEHLARALRLAGEALE